ncbi:hypothetical protein [Streptomyces sp. NPDC051636]|uniref:hypothetical protein n=1 Tax=Streptomyces sp. NPDC051636 TaxID=3365663 RepID=UPI0037AB2850
MTNSTETARTSRAVPGRQPGDIYVAAADADHHAHCPACREQAEAAEARYAEYGKSLARRDRRLIAAGRTLTVHVTEAGVTGTIRKAVTR